MNQEELDVKAWMTSLATIAANPDDDLQATAGELLFHILSDMQGRAIKDQRSLEEALISVRRRRKTQIEQSYLLHEWTKEEWTKEEWMDWYTCHELNDEMVLAGIEQWKHEFWDQDYSHQVEYEAWVKQNTRESKRKAHQSFQGAFKVHLKQKFGRASLAFRLLKHPFTKPSMLLKGWKEYVLSPEYVKEKERSKLPHDRTSGGSCSATSAEEVINSEKLLKKKKNEVLHLYKRMTKNEKLINEGKMDQESIPAHQQEPYEKYLSGHLKQELDALIQEHGYGKLRGDEHNGVLLKPRGWTGCTG